MPEGVAECAEAGDDCGGGGSGGFSGWDIGGVELETNGCLAYACLIITLK